MSSTVLIAAPDHLAPLTSRPEFDEAVAFSNVDALQALDYIMRERPGTVVLEKHFAATSRGAALINRIKADPSLKACQITIVSHETGAVQPVKARAAESAGGGVAVAAPPAPPGALDYRGTRRVPRFKVVDGVEVMVDGNPATLVNVSVAGAQVVSASILKPNQRVRVSLPGPRSRPLRVRAGVAWAAFEIPREGPRYRAGVEFVDADPETLGTFIDSKKRS